MSYVINVSLKGRHFFRTAKDSLTDEASAQIVYADICKRFPKSEGFECEMTYWRESGTTVASTRSN